MDENIAQTPPQEPVSYTRPNNSSPKFFDKFSSFFTKKTTAVLVILVLIIGVGAATIAVQRSTETRQRAATNPALIPGCGSLGDVNGDGKINSIDSSLILQYEAGLISITKIIAANADVNKDGKINSIDSSLILQYEAGLISTFSGCNTGSVISGTVYIDTNGNAVQDSGETDYSGTATIKLDNVTTATKYLGGYYFTGVASGTHTVTLTLPSGYTATTTNPVSVTVPPNGTFKFGIKSTGILTPTPTIPPNVTGTSCDSTACGRYGAICCSGSSSCIAWWQDNSNCGACGNRCSSGTTCQLNVPGDYTQGASCKSTSGPTPTVPPGATVTPIPRLSTTPTPTIPTGNAVLMLAVGLDAIGNTGDNATPNDSSGSNKTPKRPTRNVTVELFQSSTNQPVGTAKTGSVVYANGVFTGSLDLGSGFITGSYNIKVKSDGYLRRKALGVTLTSGRINTLTKITLVVGDINGDNAINILDYNILISCSVFSTDNHGACGQYAVLSDLDDNGAVDQLDYNLFLREYSVQNGD